MSFLPASTPPSTSNHSIAPKPMACSFAQRVLREGLESRVAHVRAPSDAARGTRAIAMRVRRLALHAAATASCMPCSVSHATNGDMIVPVAFCTKRSSHRALSLSHDHGAADGRVVAVEVLRRAVHGDVRAELERPLEVRRQERVVDGVRDAALARDLRDRGDVGQLERRVGRRLGEDQLRVRANAPCARRRGSPCRRT